MTVQATRQLRQPFRRFAETLADAPNGVPEVVRFMVYARQILEAQVEASEADSEWLPTLRLFCNWVIHNEVTRNPAPLLVERLNEVVHGFFPAEPPAPRDPDGRELADLMRQVNEIISLANLRRDFLNLLKAYPVAPDTLFRSGLRWREFAQRLFVEVDGKPLGFPAKPEAAKAGTKLAQRLDEMRQVALTSTIPEQHIFTTLTIAGSTGGDAKVTYHINLRLPHRSTLAIPLEVGQFADIALAIYPGFRAADRMTGPGPAMPHPARRAAQGDDSSDDVTR